eukprot:4787438-Heterocapsa_arctica.AAC.1
MRAEDIAKDSTEKAQKVYIDGSATQIGASAYAGWGTWSPDNPNFKENDALKEKTKDQTGRRSELFWLLWKRAQGKFRLSQTINMLGTRQTIC